MNMDRECTGWAGRCGAGLAELAVGADEHNSMNAWTRMQSERRLQKDHVTSWK